MMRVATPVLFVILLAEPARAVALAGLPDGMMIIAYDGESWFPYISQPASNSWLKIDAIENPAGVTRQPASGRFFVRQSDGYLHDYLPPGNKPGGLRRDDAMNLTQLRAHTDGVLAVELIDGKSRETRIVAIDGDTGNDILVRQESAQFHPLRHGDRLYYAHVSCRLECEPLIQEVWEKNLVSGQTRQLTLLNATSYLHSVDSTGRYGFISSNKKGYYNLGRLDLATGDLIWLTNGEATDSYPSIARNGSLYFLRRTAEGTGLMRLENVLEQAVAHVAGLGAESIPLPEGVRKVRYLEISQ